MLIWFDSYGYWGFVDDGVPDGWGVHVERIGPDVSYKQIQDYVDARLSLLRAFWFELQGVDTTKQAIPCKR